MFDTVELIIAAGRGGDGRISFLQEYARPKGGPDGGDGGWGGSVIVTVDPDMRSLGHLTRTPRIEAADGTPGGSNRRTGKGAKDTVVKVPAGTMIWDLDGEEPVLMADLIGPGWSLVVAAGGEPGRGNPHFKGSTNQEPLLAEGGMDGEERRVKFEVKLLADVGIVGAPNAGKSTLLSRISRARPKVADYPFTTIEPMLGVVERYGRSLVALDVPGLIEGAHEGKGLGLEFLRHVERVQVLVHLIDGTAEDLADEYMRVAAELAAYPGDLAEKPRVVAVTKLDIPEVRTRLEQQAGALTNVSGVAPLGLSPATGEGVERLLEQVLALVPIPTGPRETPRRIERPIELTRRPRVQIHREGATFVVEQRDVERVVAVADLNDWSARMQFHRLLDQHGVLKALEAAGAGSGDTVRIGHAELEWQ